ncbi:MAG TPA: EAL domain-containing response regulator [Acidobacteriaceae bacterium]|nr:EAL domain-containing response regulator [Acidobacteriaceae bacterium]
MNPQTIRILILDDEPFMHKLLVRMLDNLGYTSVTACENGHAALALIDSTNNSPNLILVDLNMPEMDGLEFVRHLVERRFNGSLILISGEDERMQQAAEKLATAHNVTVLGHLHKPASPGGLATLIGKWKPTQQNAPRAAKNVYDAEAVRAAIANGELVNYYQPKVDVASGRVVGVETLVRWRHPQDGMVFPDQFIAVAEAHGLIDDLTRVVLSNALAQTRLWLDAGLMLHVAVNLSMDNLASLDCLDMVVGLAAKAGVPAQIMELEVTETRLMEDLRMPLEIMTRLRLKRFRLSLDDFGTGNSSLAQLRDLPFDALKIDMSFVRGAWKNEKLQTMFDSCLGLAKQLGMESIAEGVEAQADWNFVRNRRCDIAQGYFIAKPMPAEDILDWSHSWQSNFQHIADAYPIEP